MYRIVSKERLAHKHNLFTVAAPEIAAKAQPGQFLIVISKEGGERVPLSICAYDRQKGTVSFAFHEVGKTTKELGTFNEGDQLFNVTGPLGNPSEIRKFGKVLCVGGSIMIAPALLQAKALKEAGNDVMTVLACRSEEFLFKKDEAKKCSDRVYVASDDGTVGEKRTGLLERHPGQGEVRPLHRHRPSGHDEEGQRDDEAFQRTDHRLPDTDNDRRHGNVRSVPRYRRR